MSAADTLSIQALLLSEGLEPDEITLLAIVDRRIRSLVAGAVSFELSARNIDRPDAAKYGTHPDGSPRYAPEWYVAQGIKTGINEGLFGALRSLLTCTSTDGGARCVGSLLHEGVHWDGSGHNWSEPAS